MRCSRRNVHHLLESRVLERLDWLDTRYQNFKKCWGDETTHLISLDEPFNGSSLKRSVTVWDIPFIGGKMLPKCRLLGLVADIHSGLPVLLGVSW
jgi:hypothetical protein